jgi:hypothetical protein
VDDKTLTPSIDPATPVTPVSGDEATPNADPASEGVPSQDEMVPKHRYVGASEEAIRQKARADALENQLWQAQQQAQPAPTPSVHEGGDPVSTTAFADGVLAGDPNAVEGYFSRSEQKLKDDLRKERDEARRAEAERQAALTALQTESTGLAGLHKPIIQNIPQWGEIDINTMATAARELRLERSGSTAAAQAAYQAADANYQSVPATSGDAEPPGGASPRFDARVHLTEEDREAVRKGIKAGWYKTEKDFFDKLPQEVQEASLREGRRVQTHEVAQVKGYKRIR